MPGSITSARVFDGANSNGGEHREATGHADSSRDLPRPGLDGLEAGEELHDASVWLGCWPALTSR